MTSAVQIDSNRRNARRSTGPRTSGGKARAKLNAMTHGLRTTVPVLPGERAEDWEAHHKGIVASLAPAGALEGELADRVALLLWKSQSPAAPPHPAHPVLIIYFWSHGSVVMCLWQRTRGCNGRCRCCSRLPNQ
jgi:hypothetical protein